MSLGKINLLMRNERFRDEVDGLGFSTRWVRCIREHALDTGLEPLLAFALQWMGKHIYTGGLLRRFAFTYGIISPSNNKRVLT